MNNLKKAIVMNLTERDLIQFFATIYDPLALINTFCCFLEVSIPAIMFV